MGYTPLIVLWALLASVVLALIVYRRVVSAHEDATLHLGRGSEAVPSPQSAVAHKLDAIDKWGKLLTALAVIYGILLFAAYSLQTWLSPVARMGL